VHALVGENGARKSTLVKILSGALRADSGEIYLDGRRLRLRSPEDARATGICTVFQELSLIPSLCVAINLYYGVEPRVRAGRIDMGALRRAAYDSISRLSPLHHIDPDRPVRELSLAERQMVEIMKALIRRPSVLVLDEATSALLPEQVQWLFRIAREVADHGGIVIFISHRLEEIQTLSDRVTVFRGGKDVGSGTMAEMREDYLVELMLGRKVERYYPPRHTVLGDGEPLVQLQEFGSPPRLHNVNMVIRRGEIVGIGGLQGQGQAELFLSLFGVRRATGTLLLNGAPLHLRNPAAALRAGIALVPEDRASEG
jgi:ribose transport system ATP-binding protein